jgi:hypothetical protein
MLPPLGAGARIEGSTPAGGHSTPSDLASLSPSGSCRWPVVVSFGAMLPCGVVCVGAQPLARSGAGGAVRAGGVAGAGGACALATPDAANSTHESNSECFICMVGKRPVCAEVPSPETNSVSLDQFCLVSSCLGIVFPENRFPYCEDCPGFRICGSGSARNVPSAASAVVR